MFSGILFFVASYFVTALALGYAGSRVGFWLVRKSKTGSIFSQYFLWTLVLSVFCALSIAVLTPLAFELIPGGFGEGSQSLIGDFWLPAYCGLSVLIAMLLYWPFFKAYLNSEKKSKLRQYFATFCVSLVSVTIIHFFIYNHYFGYGTQAPSLTEIAGGLFLLWIFALPLAFPLAKSFATYFSKVRVSSVH